MSQHTLRPQEIEALRVLLSSVAVDKSGEIGVVHGANRFVTSRYGLKAEQIEVLNSLARKVGVQSGLRRA